jgi:hypothetical protein
MAATSNSHPLAIGIGDVDGDGNNDIIAGIAGATGNPTGAILLYLNHGNGYFTGYESYPTDPATIDMTVGDFNHDGKMDVATVVASGGAQIFLAQ